MVTREDHALAARLATEAGRLLLAVRAESDGAGGGDLGAMGDRRSHRWITTRLRAERPEDAVLSEESASSGESVTSDGAGGLRGARRLWVIDPLDGTREFSEGRADFAVHVALVEDGAVAAGAVALPAEGLVFDTGDPPALPPRRRSRLRLLVSRSRAPAQAQQVAAVLDAEVVTMGSAGAKTMTVVRGLADIYLHAGGQYEWDSAAPVAVALAAGLHASRLDGGPLVYDRPDPWLPDLLVCRPELAERVVRALQEPA